MEGCWAYSLKSGGLGERETRLQPVAGTAAEVAEHGELTEGNMHSIAPGNGFAPKSISTT